MNRTPNIIVVDNEKSELIDIQNGFFNGGIPCLPIHYQYDLMTNKSGLDHITLSDFEPRIVVSDLNLRDLSLTAPIELVQPVATMLKKLELEGPYILIFWSGVAQLVDTVMATLQERFYSDINLPMYHTSIDKSQFSGSGNATALKDKLNEIIKESKLFNALMDWEGRVAISARNTTNSLFNLTKPIAVAPEADYQVLHTAKLQTILATIGNETLGVKNAKDEPEVALDLGLAPVLHDHLQGLTETQDRSIWLEAVPDIGKRLHPEQDVKAHLNSFYHVGAVSDDSQKSKRGTWIEFNSEYLNTPGNAQKIKSQFGKTIKTILHEEFLDNRQGKSEERATARNDTTIGFIELSAECDQAQRKTKLHKYLLSALIPVKHSRFTIFGEGARNTAHSGIYRLPNLMIDGEEFIVKVTFMYQIGVIPDTHKWLGLAKFSLKDQILADISYQCSQHASRPGIIRFD